MSTVTVANIESRSSGATSFSQGLTVGGVDIKTLVAVTEYHTGGTEPSSAANGAIWWDGTDVRQYINAEWIILSGSFPTPIGDRAVYGGGSVFGGTVQDVMAYIAIPTTGNATDFGDLTQARRSIAGCSSGSRGVFAGGCAASNSTYYDIMDYITIASVGDATDFGDLSGSFNSTGSCSNSTRGIIAGGDKTGVSDQHNEIQYITIASTGNTSDFGDLTHGVRRLGAGASATRALFAGEYSGNANGINYITIGSTGNAQDFGDLTNAETDGPACASTAHGGIS